VTYTNKIKEELINDIKYYGLEIYFQNQIKNRNYLNESKLLKENEKMLLKEWTGIKKWTKIHESQSNFNLDGIKKYREKKGLLVIIKDEEMNVFGFYNKTKLNFCDFKKLFDESFIFSMKDGRRYIINNMYDDVVEGYFSNGLFLGYNLYISNNNNFQNILKIDDFVLIDFKINNLEIFENYHSYNNNY
jgi:hypothetical protein